MKNGGVYYLAVSGSVYRINFNDCRHIRMEMCTIWLLEVLCIFSTLMMVKTSVNTSRNPNVKNTTQSSTYSAAYPSCKTVDGCTTQNLYKNCCSHTAVGQLEAWWQIDLEELIVMEYIQIYYRDDEAAKKEQRERFGGYQIYQSNTSDWRDDYCCYKDTTAALSALSLTPRINCTGTAQYLTIYTDRRSQRLDWYSNMSYLELCEVEVYGCPLGKYGNDNCNLDCDVGCANKLCDPETGRCLYCADGYFLSGISCIKCPSNCYDNVCDVKSGVCSACTPGYFGSYCNRTCLFTCKDNQCNQGSGVCEDCEDGFFGSSCDNCSVGCTNVCDHISGNCSPCLSAFYGTKCDQSCSAGCTNDVCTQSGGICTACKRGYYGDTCNTSCPSDCVRNICNQTSGICTECKSGFYGEDCKQTCPTHCHDSVCERSSGHCSACLTGFYGRKCDQSCPSGCKNDVCSQSEGICTACNPGYYGDTCNKRCPSNCEEDICNQTYGICAACLNGFYGRKCDQSCPAGCKNDVCSQSEGICTACEPSYFGQHCNMSCTGHCDNDECRQDNGTCIACTSGYFGPGCEEECGQCSAISCSRADGLCLCSGKPHGICGCKNGWEGEKCITKKAMSVSDDQTGTYAGAGVGTVIVIALLVIATVVILRRKGLLPKRKKENRREGKSKQFGNVESLPIHLETPRRQSNKRGTTSEDREIYVNVDIELKTDDNVMYKNIDVTGVPINKLQSIIDSKIENESAAFQEEFQTFPWGAVHPHEAGQKTSNKPKNRFKTTFPYDHSRIILETNGKDIDTNYINANYIDGIGNEKVYIASQGPKPNTLNDFWRMVWQVNSGKIIMVTNLVEGRNIKCHQYWPEEGESLVTQTFELKLDRERTYAFYVIRDISITHKKTNEERQIHQFHFTKWPDHGTPDTLELVLFNRRVTSYQTQLTGQMIVHCSAGLGRTGTFIGLNALLAHGKKTGKVDIPRYTRTMRNGRMNMIQTYEQYIALHKLLVEGFNLQELLIYRTNFPAVLATMGPMNTPANQTKIHQEFKALNALTPHYSQSCFKAALLDENLAKNWDRDILAADNFRPYLQSQLPNKTDYINAVMVQSHTSMSGYLMTQFPLVDTIDDFWTMVFDFSCENIVVLGKPTEKEDWLLEKGGDFAAGNAISVQKLQDRSPNTQLDIVDYQVERERSGSETIRVFSLSQWSSDTLLPPSDSSLLQLLEQLDSRRRSDNTRPVVVMCRDGCTQSGLFCCVANIRDQMKIDEEVDIFQTARRLKQRRPEALDNVKQYQYCYNILGKYLDSTDVYVN